MVTKKKTLPQRAAEIGVSPKTIKAWKALGVEIMDDDKVTFHISRLQKKPPNLKKGFDVPSIGRTREVSGLDEAKLQKLHIGIEQEKFKLAVLQNQYLVKAEVIEEMQGIAAITRTSLLRLVSELPQLLEGKDVKGIQKVLDDKINTTLAELSKNLTTLTDEDDS